MQTGPAWDREIRVENRIIEAGGVIQIISYFLLLGWYWSYCKYGRIDDAFVIFCEMLS